MTSNVRPRWRAIPPPGLAGLLDILLDAVPNLTVVLDREGRIVRFNRACVELTGRSEAEMVGSIVWDALVPADQIARVRDAFPLAVVRQVPSLSSSDWVTRDGRRHSIEWSSFALPVETGGAGHVLSIGVDLGRLPVRADAPGPVERISEAHLSDILAIAADAIVSVDDAQRITMFNEGAREMFGWSATEVVGQPLALLIPERFRSVHGRRHIPAFAAGDVASRRMGERREIFGLRKNGEEFAAEASISKLALGGTHIFTVVLRDVSARKRLEAAQRCLVEAGLLLGSSLDPVTTLQQAAHLGVRWLADLCIVDAIGQDGTIERIEVQHRDPVKSGLARGLQNFEVDGSAPHLSAEALRSGRSQLVHELQPEEIDALAQSVEHRALLAELSPLSYMAIPVSARGSVLGAIVFVSSTRCYDADDLLLAEELGRRAGLAIDNATLYEHARHAIHVRDEVVSIVAHDLGNPISAIRIGTTLLMRSLGADADPVARAQLAGIRASAKQMERLITDLLDLRRIETGRLILDRRAHTPASMIDPIAGEFSLLAADRGVDLEIDIDVTAPASIDADADRFIQVLENLTANALKFTPSGGSVSIRAYSNFDGEAMFEVRDSGRGIAAEQLPHLFERFWQAEHSTRRSVGLGLAIAQGIVEAHGGRIWAESEPGHGAAFFVAMPSTMPDLASGAFQL
jgi:PAS domain S-box-containing protein